jgi:hypothetical protein
VELENQTSVRREDSKKPSSSEPDPHECSSEDLSTSILTPSTLDDWTDVGGQGRFPAMNHLENLQKTDRYNLELCESLAVDLLDTIYISCVLLLVLRSRQMTLMAVSYCVMRVRC